MYATPVEPLATPTDLCYHSVKYSSACSTRESISALVKKNDATLVHVWESIPTSTYTCMLSASDIAGSARKRILGRDMKTPHSIKFKGLIRWRITPLRGRLIPLYYGLRATLMRPTFPRFGLGRYSAFAASSAALAAFSAARLAARARSPALIFGLLRSSLTPASSRDPTSSTAASMDSPET